MLYQIGGIREQSEKSPGMDKENIFALWLRAKGEKLFYSDIPLTTEKNVFRQYIRIGLGEAHGEE